MASCIIGGKYSKGFWEGDHALGRPRPRAVGRGVGEGVLRHVRILAVGTVVLVTSFPPATASFDPPKERKISPPHHHYHCQNRGHHHYHHLFFLWGKRIGPRTPTGDIASREWDAPQVPWKRQRYGQEEFQWWSHPARRPIRVDRGCGLFFMASSRREACNAGGFTDRV